MLNVNSIGGFFNAVRDTVASLPYGHRPQGVLATVDAYMFAGTDQMGKGVHSIAGLSAKGQADAAVLAGFTAFSAGALEAMDVLAPFSLPLSWHALGAIGIGALCTKHTGTDTCYYMLAAFGTADEDPTSCENFRYIEDNGTNTANNIADYDSMMTRP